MTAVKRDDNREPGIVAQNTNGTGVIYPTGVTLANSTPQHVAIVDSNGDQIKGFGNIGLAPYDYVSRALTNPTTETYTFKTGGSSGTTTNTIVIVYTDSTLATILSVTKT